MGTGLGLYENPAARRAMIIGETVTLAKPRFGKTSGTENEVIVCTTAGERADVIIPAGEYTSGDLVEVFVLGLGGIFEVECGEAADQFDYVATDADGIAVEATAGDVILGKFAEDVVDDQVGGIIAQSVSLSPDSTTDLTTLLASTSNGEGASLVGIEDSAGKITATTVEGALAEIAAITNGITATAAEINARCDQSANEESITEAGALSTTKTESKLTGPGSGTYAVTLAAPTVAEVGRLKIITMTATTANNAVTMALTNVVGGSQSSSASFDAAGETLVLLGIRVAATTYRWLVLKEYGVTLS